MGYGFRHLVIDALHMALRLLWAIFENTYRIAGNDNGPSEKEFDEVMNSFNEYSRQEDAEMRREGAGL